jgi:hypothetical protein
VGLAEAVESVSGLELGSVGFFSRLSGTLFQSGAILHWCRRHAQSLLKQENMTSTNPP